MWHRPKALPLCRAISTSYLMRRRRLSCPPWRVVTSVQAGICSHVLVRLCGLVVQLLHPSFRYTAAYVGLPYMQLRCARQMLAAHAGLCSATRSSSGSTSSVPVDDQGQNSSMLVGRGLSAPAAPSRVRVTVSAANGDMCSEDVFPFFLELTCRIGDAILKVAATSPGADFRGGFRRVYLLSGHEAVENLVLKLGKSLEDNVNELRAASLCPSAFSEVAASGSIQISLQPNTLLDAHYILAEKVVPVTEVLKLDPYPSADARALLGYKCMRALCNASLCGVKCRDLGVLQWGLRGTLSAGR